jgi:hypothetical protein
MHRRPRPHKAVSKWTADAPGPCTKGRKGEMWSPMFRPVFSRCSSALRNPLHVSRTYSRFLSSSTKSNGGNPLLSEEKVANSSTPTDSTPSPPEPTRPSGFIGKFKEMFKKYGCVGTRLCQSSALCDAFLVQVCRPRAVHRPVCHAAWCIVSRAYRGTLPFMKPRHQLEQPCTGLLLKEIVGCIFPEGEHGPHPR